MERAAADRIFGLLPQRQSDRIKSLRDEYEARRTPTARFAYVLDRLQPLLLNAASGGASWIEHGICHSQTVAVNRPIADGAKELWALANAILTKAAEQELLVDDRDRAPNNARDRSTRPG